MQNPFTTASGFAVHRGSLARANSVKSMRESNRKLRQELIDNGTLVPINDTQLRLTRTHVFNTPSQVASVMCGGNRNGLDEWRTTAAVDLARPAGATPGANSRPPSRLCSDRLLKATTRPRRAGRRTRAVPEPACRGRTDTGPCRSCRG
nr:hypothetical protein KPHV_22530 [Kitasatospora purpeofusca]